MPGHEPLAIAPVDKPNELSQNDQKLQDTSVWHGDGTYTPLDQSQSIMMLNNYNEASDDAEEGQEEDEE